MDDWWDQLDTELLGCLEARGPMTPGELGDKLGLAEGAVSSMLAMLAQQGKVRIRLVEGTER